MGGVIIKKKVRGIPEHGLGRLHYGIRPHEKGYGDPCHSFTRTICLGLFFGKLKSIVVDGLDLCFIFDRHKSIDNDIVRAYNQFSNHFVEFKNYYHETTFFLEHELGFEKWSIAYFPNNKYDMMTANIVEWINAMLIAERKYLVASIFNSIAKRFGEKFRERRAYVLNYKDKKFVHAAEKIAKDSMSEGDFFYVENINRDDNQFTVFGRGPMARFNLLKKSCSSRKYDLFKIPCAHAMAAL
ncbi:hypothetical protein T459_12295 [Capsicum annuum]|uniref:SWIM-type domain-containing protein n=1 Tax=Capsicum annuum TaxID=4072 RepID=A0A2G2ZPD7_CAPAN|nr:hypothetical protein T459_12295 [Capsicum annuum]